MLRWREGYTSPRTDKWHSWNRQYAHNDELKLECCYGKTAKPSLPPDDNQCRRVTKLVIQCSSAEKGTWKNIWFLSDVIKFYFVKKCSNLYLRLKS
jgi:hypothetical protein